MCWGPERRASAGADCPAERERIVCERPVVCMRAARPETANARSLWGVREGCCGSRVACGRQRACFVSPTSSPVHPRERGMHAVCEMREKSRMKRTYMSMHAEPRGDPQLTEGPVRRETVTLSASSTWLT